MMDKEMSVAFGGNSRGDAFSVNSVKIISGFFFKKQTKRSTYTHYSYTWTKTWKPQSHLFKSFESFLGQIFTKSTKERLAVDLK